MNLFAFPYPLTADAQAHYHPHTHSYLLSHLLGKTPCLPHNDLESMGYTVAAYPITILSAVIKATERVLDRLKEGEGYDDLIMNFEDVKDVVGFNKYYGEEERYRTS